MNFFIAAATEAGIALSPHLAQRKPSTSNGVKRKKAKRGRGESEPEAAPPPPPAAPLNGSQGLVQQLLSKFPAFDPKWDKELQEAWFSGFDKLMDHTDAKRAKKGSP